MMEITAEIRALIDKAAACVELAGDEYIDPADAHEFTICSRDFFSIISIHSLNNSL